MKYLLCLVCFVVFSGAAFAADESAVQAKPKAAVKAQDSTDAAADPTKPAPPVAAKKKKKHFRSLEFLTIALTFFSWTEDANVNGPTASAKGNSNLYGNSIMWEEEFYNNPRFGYLFQGALLLGLANVSSSSATTPYHLVDQHWFGVNTSVRAAYRITSRVIVSAGPNFIYRMLNCPADSGTTVTSGSSFNVGGTADLRLRLTNFWELRQEIGTLAIKAHTFWSLGFGYKF